MTLTTKAKVFSLFLLDLNHNAVFWTLGTPTVGPGVLRTLVGEMFAMALNEKKKVIKVDMSSPRMLGSPAAPPSTGFTLPFSGQLLRGRKETKHKEIPHSKC